MLVLTQLTSELRKHRKTTGGHRPDSSAFIPMTPVLTSLTEIDTGKQPVELMDDDDDPSPQQAALEQHRELTPCLRL